MMEQEILRDWRRRASRACDAVEELEIDVESLRYEAKITQRLLDKAVDKAGRETWQAQMNTLQSRIDTAQAEIAEKRKDLALCEAMVAEIEADLGPELSKIGYCDSDEDLPF